MTLEGPSQKFALGHFRPGLTLECPVVAHRVISLLRSSNAALGAKRTVIGS
jgi:hypothetical protein